MSKKNSEKGNYHEMVKLSKVKTTSETFYETILFQTTQKNRIDE